jgi:predicted nucleic acid-binding protein
MILTKALVDTNICIDAAQKRKPFYRQALTIIEYAQSGVFSGMVAAHSFDTIFYILNKRNSIESTYTVLDGLRRAFEVAPVTQKVIDQAIALKWKDFEDAIHYQAAKAGGCDAIITRNEKDFQQSELPVLSPQAFLYQFKNDEEE